MTLRRGREAPPPAPLPIGGEGGAHFHKGRGLAAFPPSRRPGPVPLLPRGAAGAPRCGGTGTGCEPPEPPDGPWSALLALLHPLPKPARLLQGLWGAFGSRYPPILPLLGEERLPNPGFSCCFPGKSKISARKARFTGKKVDVGQMLRVFQRLKVMGMGEACCLIAAVYNQHKTYKLEIKSVL